MEAAAESAKKMKNVICTTPAACSALQPEGNSPFQALQIAMKKYCLVKGTTVSELEDLHDLKGGSALHQSVNLVLGSPPYNARSARGQTKLAHDVFSRGNIKGAVGLISNVMPSRAQGQIFCSKLMFYSKNKVSVGRKRWQMMRKVVSRGRRKGFRTSFKYRSRLSSAIEAPGCTTVIFAFESFSKHPCRNPPFLLGEKVWHGRARWR